MYSRKIKQMKKKLLNSQHLNSKNGGGGSSSATGSYDIGGGGGGGGGGLHSNWGPRVALYERELQEQQRRSREEQEQLYLAAKQQEIYNKSRASGTTTNSSNSHSHSHSGKGGGGSGSGSGSGGGNGNGSSVFKNPYATSGIGIHTTNGFICKANKKLMITAGQNSENGQNGNEDLRNRVRQNLQNYNHKAQAQAPPDKPLRVRIPSPDPSPPPPPQHLLRRRHAAASPIPTNESLASTKTYHSSGGSSHSSSSTLSSRGSGRSSLIVGSDHHDSSVVQVHGNYNINGGYDDDEDDDEDDYNDGHHLHVPSRMQLHGRKVRNGAHSPILPLPPSQSTMSSSNNVKLINVHLIDDDEMIMIGGRGGRAAAAADAASRSRTKSGVAATRGAGGGYYGENIVRGHGHAKITPAGSSGQKEHAYEKRLMSNASKLIQGFNMVYVPMESTKTKSPVKDETSSSAPAAAVSDDLPIMTSHRRRQLVPPSESAGYGYGGGVSQLPEEETCHIAANATIQAQQPPSSSSYSHAHAHHPPENDTGRKTNVSSGSTADADSLLESFDSVLFKPKSNGSPAEKLESRKKSPPPLPPKSRPHILLNSTIQQQATSTTTTTTVQQQESIPASATKHNKNLRFSEHLDVKTPSPYTTISYEAAGQEPEEAGENSSIPNSNSNADRRSSSLTTADENPAAGGAAAAASSTSGPTSRTSVYSACTTTTTLLSCGHLRDSYSTLSSLNSDQFTDDNDEEGQRQQRQQHRSVNTGITTGAARAQDHSVDTSIDCPIGDDDNDDDDLDIDHDRRRDDDDPNKSHKSALQQLRDLSILIGGSFHTSPMIQTATAAVAAAAAAAGNKENLDKYGKAAGVDGRGVGVDSKLGEREREPVTLSPTIHKNYTKAQVRKFSTETSNDSGKGSVTGSGRSRSEAGGSGSGRTNSIMQLLQNLPAPAGQSADASTTTPANQHQHQLQRQPKIHKMHVNGNSKSILAALNKITRPPPPPPSKSNPTTMATDHHGHHHSHSHHDHLHNISTPAATSNSNPSPSTLCCCSCDDSEQSSCLFQPECEECQQVFGNPFEILPELKYIDSSVKLQQQQQQRQTTSSSQTKQHNNKKIKVLTSKKELTRKNSYRVKTNPKLSSSYNSSSSNGNGNKSNLNMLSKSLKSGPGPMPQLQLQIQHEINTEQIQKQQQQQHLIKLGYSGIAGTKTQLLLSKSAAQQHHHQRSSSNSARDDQSNDEIGCLGCYNEQLMLAAAAGGGGGVNCSGMMNMINPANLFTIDEAAEENDGTLLHIRQNQQQAHAASAGAAPCGGVGCGASSSCYTKLAHNNNHHRHGYGTAMMTSASAATASATKTKKSHKTKYGRSNCNKKKSSTKKSSSHPHHSHHHHHHHHNYNQQTKYVHTHPKCWLATDATMGWSDLESLYSQNMKNLDSPNSESNGSSSNPHSNSNSNPSNTNINPLAAAAAPSSQAQYVNGECLMCWKELMQYKYNNLPALTGIVDPNVSYTVERTKRMFIWLNRRPKEFNEPWWEAKKQASVKWLITKAYSHLPKGSVQHPFKESKRDKVKLILKDQVMAGLATGKLYCMALANLFQNCTPEERQSIFGSTAPLREKQHHERQHVSDDDDDELLKSSKKSGGGGNINLSLSHWEIIKILSRKGIYVAQPSDMKLTEGTLRQRKPFRITAHIALIEAVMGLYAKVMLTRERIEPIVSNLRYSLDPGTQSSEEFILAWLNAVIDTLKAYILSTNINNARKSGSSSSSSGGGVGIGSASSSTTTATTTAAFTHHRWLNVHPITDLRDLFDGIGLCSLFILYFSTEITFDQVHVNEPGETLSIYDSITNLNLAYDLTSQVFPQTIHHLRLTDLLYIHGYMKQNVLQLLLDIFYFTELVPIDRVSRLTHVPLRIQL